MIVLSLSFFALAAICNAIQDTSSHHYNQSIFIMFNNPQWWNGEISWRQKYVSGSPALGRKKIMDSHINYPVQLTDAFHFFKTLMIVFVCLSIVTFTNPFSEYWYSYVLLIGIYGTIWNSVFSVFYNKILLK